MYLKNARATLLATIFTAVATTFSPLPARAQEVRNALSDNVLDVAPPAWKNDSRYAEVVVDAVSGHVLYDQHAGENRHIASLTKIMTAYLTFEALRDGRLARDQALLISSRAAHAAPDEIGLKAGQKISVEDAIHAMTAVSSNGAAVVLAEAIAGSEGAFAARMTKKASALGAKKTVFRNANGLTAEGQRATAEDIAVIFSALRRDFPGSFDKYFSQQYVTIRNQKKINCYLCGYENIIGQKSGYTSAAGKSLAVVTDDGKHSFVIVTLGAADADRAGQPGRVSRIIEIVNRLRRQSP